MAKPTSPPPPGWEWVLNETEDPPLWALSRLDPRGPELTPTEAGHYSGWQPGMPDALPKPGYRWVAPPARDGVSQGFVQVKNGETFEQTQAPGYNWYPSGNKAKNANSHFTPTADLPATPATQPPYAGNAPLPVKNPWQAIMGRVSKWSWKPQGPRKV